MQWVKKRLLVVVGVFLLCLVVATSLSLLPSSFAGAAPNSIGSPTSTERSCAIKSVGWLICPVVSFFSEIGDRAFSMLANMFLETEPEIVAANSGTKNAWEQARNLANILFIIAFLVIIFSQVTGFGITNYGIKRMLPRLIVAALAVNVSYYICQLMVDLTNIAGWTIKDFLTDTAYQVSKNAAMPVSIKGTDFQTNAGAAADVGGILVVVATAVLAGVAVYFFLPALLSAVVVVVISCVIIILTLLLRKAIIVILVVLSPIAFVMYLLPNTEKLFSKWLKMFWQLLMVFPVVALLMGGGQLASAIVLSTGSKGNTGIYQSATNQCVNLPDPKQPIGPNNQATVVDCDAKGAPIMLGLTAALIAVAPLLAVYPVLQGALSATGSLGGKIQAMGKMASNPARRRLKENREFAQLKRRRQALQGNNRILNATGLTGILRGGERRRATMDNEKSRYNKERVRYTARAAVRRNEETGENELTGYGRRLAGGTGPRGWGAQYIDEQRTIADAQNAQRALDEEDKKTAHIEVDRLNRDQILRALSADNLANLDRNDPRSAALIERAFEVGSEELKEQIIDAIGSGGRETFASRTLGAVMQANNPGFYSSTDIDAVIQGQVGSPARDPDGEVIAPPSARVMTGRALHDGRMSGQKMAAASEGQIRYAIQLADQEADPDRQAAMYQRLQRSASQVWGNENLRSSLGNTEGLIEQMATRGPQSVNAPAPAGGGGGGTPPAGGGGGGTPPAGGGGGGTPPAGGGGGGTPPAGGGGIPGAYGGPGVAGGGGGPGGAGLTGPYGA